VDERNLLIVLGRMVGIVDGSGRTVGVLKEGKVSLMVKLF